MIIAPAIYVSKLTEILESSGTMLPFIKKSLSYLILAVLPDLGASKTLLWVLSKNFGRVPIGK
jgi:hypothetical protein